MAYFTFGCFWARILENYYDKFREKMKMLNFAARHAFI